MSHLFVYETAGNKEGHPSPKGTLRWTAGQMMHLVCVSIPLMSEMMSPLQCNHDVWKSWVAHVNYFLWLLQTDFSETDLKRLESKIKQAHKAFLKVPEFDKLWLPKHHFALHFVDDIRRYGPPLAFIGACALSLKTRNANELLQPGTIMMQQPQSPISW